MRPLSEQKELLRILQSHVRDMSESEMATALSTDPVKHWTAVVSWAERIAETLDDLADYESEVMELCEPNCICTFCRLKQLRAELEGK